MCSSNSVDIIAETTIDRSNIFIRRARLIFKACSLDNAIVIKKMISAIKNNIPIYVETLAM